MSYKEIKEKYEKILVKYGIDGIIELVSGLEYPIQETKEENGNRTITASKSEKRGCRGVF